MPSLTWCCAALVSLVGSASARAAPAAGADDSAPVGDAPPHAAAATPEPDYLALADTPLFLPGNYLAWGTAVGPPAHREPLIFSLDYALHLPVFNDVRTQLLAGNRWAGAATISFEGALRMLSLDSDPVRMPSYRPSVSGQLFFAVHRAHPLLFGLRGSLYHYSNGQEHCAFDPTLSDLSSECAAKIRATRDLGASLNRESGNFSTTGWLVALNGRLHRVNEHGVAFAHLSAGLSYSGMARSLPGGLDAPTRDLYGVGRVEVSLEAKQRLGWAAVTARGAFVHFVRADARVPSDAGQAECVLAPYWLSGIGLFARYFRGRDPYNAFFVDHLQQLSLGIAWDGERPLKFAVP